MLYPVQDLYIQCGICYIQSGVCIIGKGLYNQRGFYNDALDICNVFSAPYQGACVYYAPIFFTRCQDPSLRDLASRRALVHSTAFAALFDT